MALTVQVKEEEASLESSPTIIKHKHEESLVNAMGEVFPIWEKWYDSY